MTRGTGQLNVATRSDRDKKSEKGPACSRGPTKSKSAIVYTSIGHDLASRSSCGRFKKSVAFDLPGTRRWRDYIQVTRDVRPCRTCELLHQQEILGRIHLVWGYIDCHRLSAPTEGSIGRKCPSPSGSIFFSMTGALRLSKNGQAPGPWAAFGRPFPTSTVPPPQSRVRQFLIISDSLSASISIMCESYAIFCVGCQTHRIIITGRNSKNPGRSAFVIPLSSRPTWVTSLSNIENTCSSSTMTSRKGRDLRSSPAWSLCSSP
jgi:hypothetical protein